jgi:hypothetical protein
MAGHIEFPSTGRNLAVLPKSAARFNSTLGLRRIITLHPSEIGSLWRFGLINNESNPGTLTLALFCMANRYVRFMELEGNCACCDQDSLKSPTSHYHLFPIHRSRDTPAVSCQEWNSRRELSDPNVPRHCILLMMRYPSRHARTKSNRWAKDPFDAYAEDSG